MAVPSQGSPYIPLREITCRFGSHSVTCHPTAFISAEEG